MQEAEFTPPSFLQEAPQEGWPIDEASTEAELCELQRQNTLILLDLDFQREERRLVGRPPRLSHGAHRAIIVIAAMLGGCLGLGLAFLGLVTRGAGDFESVLLLLMFLVGLGIIAVSVGAAVFSKRNRDRYERALAAYQRRRAALLDERPPAKAAQPEQDKAKADRRRRQRG